MKKPTVNLIVDAIALVLLAGLVGTGILIEYRLPPGSGGEGHGSGAAALTLWKMTRHQWGGIHLQLAFGFIAAMAVHLVLHWRWVLCIAKRDGTASGALRMGLVLSAAAISAALLLLPFLAAPHRQSTGTSASPSSQLREEGGAAPGPLRGGAGRGEGFIRGGMTLDEVSRETHLGLEQMRTLLGAQRSLRGDEKLGRLLEDLGIDMQEARRRLHPPDSP